MDKATKIVTRAAEPRGNFPRVATSEDWEWSLDEDHFRKLCMTAMTYSQAEYCHWNGFGRSSMDDVGFDYFAELDRNGYWVALLQDDGETIAPAKDWQEAGQYEKEHGSECVVVVLLQPESENS